MYKSLKNLIQLFSLVIIFFFLLTKYSLGQSEIDSTQLKYIDIKVGDICIVCDMPLDSQNGIGFLFKGRRVTLDLKHISEFISQPEKYFHKLRANVVLYDEGTFDKYQISNLWFVIGIWILFALLSSALSANLAMKKGMSFNRWFYIGLFTNIFGLIYLILISKKQSKILPERLGKISQTETPLKCKNCDQFNHPNAKKCTSCGELIKPVGESEVEKIWPKKEKFNGV